MKQISIMRYDVEQQKYRVFKSFNSDTIPRVGEKIVFKEDGSSAVVDVFDVHYSLDLNNVDVYVVELGDYEEYKSGMVL